MPRRAKPWFKASHRAWYVKVKGKTIRLGETEDEAWKEFHRVMSSQASDEAVAKPGERVRLDRMLDLWLRAKSKEVKPKTTALARVFVQNLTDFAPAGMLAAEVRPSTVADWLSANPAWSKTTRSIAVRHVKAAFAWGAFDEWIPRNPLARMKAPKPDVRPPADLALVEQTLAEVSVEAREVFLFMYLTGARPGEAISVEARRIDWTRGTARVVGKMGERDVVIPSEHLPALKLLADDRPKGPLFRNARDGAWTPQALRAQIGRAKQRLGVTGRFVPYHLRGIFASERIAAGVGDSLVGKMLGHSNPYTLHKHYHNPDLATLREAVDRETVGRKKKARPEPGD